MRSGTRPWAEHGANLRTSCANRSPRFPRPNAASTAENCVDQVPSAKRVTQSTPASARNPIGFRRLAMNAQRSTWWLAVVALGLLSAATARADVIRDEALGFT